MRSTLLTIAVFCAASPAGAGGIETIVPADARGQGVTVMRCDTCPALQPDHKTVTYVVPEIAPGTDRSELREIGGEMKIVRTESWLGGSPVTFISKASDGVIKAAQAQADGQPLLSSQSDARPDADLEPQAVIGLDTQINTSAVSAASSAFASVDVPSRKFDSDTFELRLK